MARRRLFWHIGPDDLGTAFLRDALAAATFGPGVHAAASSDEARDLVLDLRHTHREHGRRRRDVEGAWARVERRIWHHKGVSLLSTPDLAPADRDAIRLALDGLRGVEVHLVLLNRTRPERVRAEWERSLSRGATTSLSTYTARVTDPAEDHPQAKAFRAGHDETALLTRWAHTVPAEHVHPVDVDGDPASIWSAFLAEAGLVGVGLPELAPAAPLTDHAADLLREVNATLDHPSYAEAGAARTLVAGAGADSTAAALAEAAREIARLETRLAELEADNTRLDRKRRKHKRRLRELQQRPDAAA